MSFGDKHIITQCSAKTFRCVLQLVLVQLCGWDLSLAVTVCWSFVLYQWLNVHVCTHTHTQSCARQTAGVCAKRLNLQTDRLNCESIKHTNSESASCTSVLTHSNNEMERGSIIQQRGRVQSSPILSVSPRPAPLALAHTLE